MGPTTHLAMAAPSVGVFFSPPEASKPDSFAVSDSPLKRPAPHAHGEPVSLPPISSLLSSVNRSPLSPPVSPLAAGFGDSIDAHPRHSAQASASDRDYELFPHKQTASAGHTSPLFKAVDEPDRNDIEAINLHIKSRPADEHTVQPPTREDYELAISFRSSVIDKIKADPLKWIKQEQEYLNRIPPRFPQASAPSTLSIKRKAPDDARPAKRQRAAPKPLTEKLPAPKRVARPQPRDVPTDAAEQQPVVKHRRKVSRVEPTSREDMDFRNVPDLSPSLSTIAPGKSLKVDWKGHPLDLSADPDLHELHDLEVPLASTLRLTAGQYLYAKRKIFQRFVELSRIGKDFNKTSAQGVCKIDVNKASKLWTAFDKVGWFDKRLFTQYL